MQTQVQNDAGSPEELAAKQEFITLMTRGGFIEPTDLLFSTCIYAIAMFDGVMENEIMPSSTELLRSSACRSGNFQNKVQGKT